MSLLRTFPKSGGIIVPQNLLVHPQTNRKTGIVLVGPPATGKQVVAEAFLNRGIVHYSSSAALREYSEKHNYPEVLEQMRAGSLVEFEHVETVSSWHYQDFISYYQFGVFDGWGRVEREFQELLGVVFRVCDVDVHIVILHADRKIAEERSRGRGRYDHDVFGRRYDIYEDNIGPVTKRSVKLFGKERVHRIDTTHLSKEEVVQTVFGLVPIPN